MCPSAGTEECERAPRRVDWRSMDPLQLQAALAGAACAVCGAPLSAQKIRILARREDLAFVELPCPICGSVALGLVLAAADGSLRVDGVSRGEFTVADELRFASAPPISADDVLAVHEVLASHTGGLVDLLGERWGPGG